MPEIMNESLDPKEQITKLEKEIIGIVQAKGELIEDPQGDVRSITLSQGDVVEVDATPHVQTGGLSRTIDHTINILQAFEQQNAITSMLDFADSKEYKTQIEFDTTGSTQKGILTVKYILSKDRPSTGFPTPCTKKWFEGLYVVVAPAIDPITEPRQIIKTYKELRSAIKKSLAQKNTTSKDVESTLRGS